MLFTALEEIFQEGLEQDKFGENVKDFVLWKSVVDGS